MEASTSSNMAPTVGPSTIDDDIVMNTQEASALHAHARETIGLEMAGTSSRSIGKRRVGIDGGDSEEDIQSKPRVSLLKLKEWGKQRHRTQTPSKKSKGKQKQVSDHGFSDAESFYEEFEHNDDNRPSTSRRPEEV
jgi:hypothetical protein